MRRLLRSIARARMKAEGIQHINRPKSDGLGRRTSFFAENWRKYATSKH